METIQSNIQWAVAVFAARENASELFDTIKAIVGASTTNHTIIDVLVNGNGMLASEITKRIKDAAPDGFSGTHQVRIWDISLGGKAHAWNQYVHVIWPGSKLAFFVDGYATVSCSSFKLLALELGARSDAIAGTGICLSGRGAAALNTRTLTEGGIQGALFVLTEATMLAFRRRKFDLPLGLYGFDTLLGAVLGYGGDPSAHAWDAKRYIASHPSATFTVIQKKWWSYSDAKTRIKRILNNALRVLVREATKYYFSRLRLPPEEVPKTIEDYVKKWVADCPEESGRILLWFPLSRIVLGNLNRKRDWSLAEQLPRLVYSHPST